ncbi:FUSC family protein [Flavobacterium sp.]|uniref:FUSC family protein n=1 Tax=Flavobacterium sp. TaxID=239 RepID=UPI00286BA445|nr:FUSC family protein [Flavobacterium sp.]
MKKLDLTQLTNEELLEEAKKRKSAFNALKFIIGLLVGVSIYITIKNGFGVFTVLPIVFVSVIVAMKISNDETQKEIKSRNINE